MYRIKICTKFIFTPLISLVLLNGIVCIVLVKSGRYTSNSLLLPFTRIPNCGFPKESSILNKSQLSLLVLLLIRNVLTKENSLGRPFGNILLKEILTGSEKQFGKMKHDFVAIVIRIQVSLTLDKAE